jgi:hypothetical protein
VSYEVELGLLPGVGDRRASNGVIGADHGGDLLANLRVPDSRFEDIGGSLGIPDDDPS